MSLRHGRINVNCLNKTSARTEQVLKHTHTLESQRSQTHTHTKNTNTNVTCLFRWMNVCPSGSVADVCMLFHSHTVTHTLRPSVCLASAVTLFSLSLSVNLSLSQTICGVERRSVRLEVQLVKECLLSAC